MPLSAADLSTLSRLYDQALAVDEAAREDWLAALPEAQQVLVPALRRMLHEQARAGGTSGILSSLPSLGEPPAPDGSVATAGDLVGPYRLLREIGRGGMGAVWLAERADGAFKRQVALKLPRLAWGAGLGARMAREREIGAMLEHPHIARLYDAGVDDRGRPYIALEHIEGHPIDAWCRERKLGVRQKLELLVQVARAVAYAHGRLVVHRDLKPSNVLVSADGQVHLLDFGIAKLLQDEAGDGPTGLTQEHGRLLTPHYASPEQIAGAPVTVQSDVYGLGVLAYELLTGRLPYEPARKTLAALEEAILQGEPDPPSTRVHDKALARQLRGDVDAIVGKALKREPSARYASAEAVNDDLVRHLKGVRVGARPDTRFYRLTRDVRRHGAGIGLGTVISGMVVASIGHSWQLGVRAEQSSQREHIVKAVLAEVLRGTARASLGDSAAGLGVLSDTAVAARVPGLAQDPRLQADIYAAIVDAYGELGAHARAAKFAQLRLESLGAAGALPEELATARVQLAQVLLDEGRFDEALNSAIEAQANGDVNPTRRLQAQVAAARAWQLMGLDIQAKQAVDELSHWTVPDSKEARLAELWAWCVRAGLSVNQDRLSDARDFFDRAIDQASRHVGPRSVEVALMRLEAAQVLARTSYKSDAQKYFDDASAILSSNSGEHGVRAMHEAVRFTSERYYLGRQISAEKALRDVRHARDSIAATGMVLPEEMLARADFWEARIWIGWGHVGHATRLMQRSAPVLLASAGGGIARSQVAGTYADVLLQNGQHEQAQRWFEEQLRLLRQAGLAHTAGAAPAYRRTAENLIRGGKPDEALVMLGMLPEFASSGRDAQSIRNAETANLSLRLTRVVALLESGRAGEAYAAFPRELLSEDGANSPGTNHAARMNWGMTLCTHGQHARGLSEWLAALKHAESEYYVHSPEMAYNRAKAGLCALKSGDRVTAIRLMRRARAAFDDQREVSPWLRAPLLQLEAALRVRR